MRRAAVLLVALLAGLSSLAFTREVAASQWGSSYGDPWGFCPAQSFLPSTYTTVVTNDPLVGSNPEQDTFWGVHPYPGYDDWYGYWYGDFRGSPGDSSGWRYITTSWYGQQKHWNFGDWGWAVHGHAKQYISYFNWTFGGQCGMGWYGALSPAPYMADVYGYPVVDIYVDSTPPDPPRPRITGVTTGSVGFTWDPVGDRGDGSGADYWASGFDHFTSWLTVGGGPPLQRANSAVPRTLTASGLAPGQTACVHVIAYDRLQNATPEEQACGRVLSPPPVPAAPPAPAIGVSPVAPGLVGLDTWFWLTPTPAAITGELSLNGYRYRLTQVPASVEWAFGDGSTQTLPAPAGAGQPYASPSPVTHVYERHSASGYPVRATVNWTLSWSVLAGGAWYGPYAMGSQSSPPAALSYPVRQAQTELLAP